MTHEPVTGSSSGEFEMGVEFEMSEMILFVVDLIILLTLFFSFSFFPTGELRKFSAEPSLYLDVNEMLVRIFKTNERGSRKVFPFINLSILEVYIFIAFFVQSRQKQRKLYFVTSQQNLLVITKYYGYDR